MALDLVVLGSDVKFGVFAFKLADVLILQGFQYAACVGIGIVDDFPEGGIELALQNRRVLVHCGFNVGQMAVVVLGGMLIVTPPAAITEAKGHGIAPAIAPAVAVATSKNPEEDQQENDNSPNAGTVGGSCALTCVEHNKHPTRLNDSGKIACNTYPNRRKRSAKERALLPLVAIC